MSNRICAILGCRYPILEGGLAYVGNGLLAAAVSEGGGFGQVGSGGRSPEDLARQIEVALEHTGAPFGVNVPLSEHRDVSPYFAVIEEMVRRHPGRIRAVSLSAGNPRPWIPRVKEWGLAVITLASTPEQAQKAEAAGADLVVCEGTEAGGHNGPAELTTFALIPNVVDAVRIPVVAAGGIADGRTVAAALCLGAEGVQMGTRFVATVECQAHENYKALLVKSRAQDTVVMERSFGRVTRVLRSPYAEAILQQEARTPGSETDLLPMVSGRMNARAALEGDVEGGWMNAGQSVGLVHEVLPAAEVVRRVVAQAAAVLGRSQSDWASWTAPEVTSEGGTTHIPPSR
ncbi:nitronate monooxygenase [Alicyclobacillus sp.]|uniref:NAD(P)H-dependent flavin oxidoreductase n=1 Tax=Alicyclobacillus sp. TaxID=61169 RepID=UPI0025B7C1C5|nr:nitronate monooxygenase [Alicyclobacillus sp.]